MEVSKGTRDSAPDKKPTDEPTGTVPAVSSLMPLNAVPVSAASCATEFRDQFHLFRKQMEHEDTLVSHRITYGAVIQTALVTGFVFAHNIAMATALDRDESVDTAFVRRGICWVGLIMVGYLFVGILAAQQATRQLAKKAKAVLDKWRDWANESNYDLPIPEYPNGGGTRWIDAVGFIFGPWAFLVFALLWAQALGYIPDRPVKPQTGSAEQTHPPVPPPISNGKSSTPAR